MGIIYIEESLTYIVLVFLSSFDTHTTVFTVFPHRGGGGGGGGERAAPLFFPGAPQMYTSKDRPSMKCTMHRPIASVQSPPPFNPGGNTVFIYIANI